MRIAALVLATCLAAPALAATQEPTKYIAVAGEASAEVAPDNVVFEIRVGLDKPTAGEGLAPQAKMLAAVLEAVTAIGVAPRDIQTLGPTVAFAHGTEDNPNREGFHVQNILAVRLRDLSKFANLIRAAESAGATVAGCRYDISDRAAREDELRSTAVDNARHRAEIFARAAGKKLGAVHTIIEQGAQAGLSSTTKTPPLTDRGYADLESLTSGALELHMSVYAAFGVEDP